MESLNDVWSAVCDYCRSKVNEITFNVWFAELSLTELSGNQAYLFVRADFKRRIVLENYKHILAEAFEEVLTFPVEITIRCEDDLPSSPLSISNAQKSQYDYTFDTFIVGASNRFAHAASLAVAEKPSVIYNPLFIWGNSGLGKTHLLNAICTRIREIYPQKKIVSLSCETFANEFIYSLSQGTTNQFREKYRNVDVLLVDDIQFIAGKESTQEEFFNTFNTLYENHKQMVLTSDRPPRDIATLSERLRFRFEQGLISDIQPPEFETRVGIIKRKVQLLEFDLPDDIVYFIAEQLKANIRQLEGVVKKLQAVALLSNEPITIAIAQDAIRDIRNDDQPEEVTVDKIVEEVAKIYSVSKEDILSAKHDAPISFARQIAMYIIREITQMPYESIGECFNRHHSTVLYTINKVRKNVIARDPKERDRINDIIKNLQS